ncbi:hypothetical protein [Nonomuraea helvata]|uniref:Uncharacterized protein n=1 Tax=Nonomuraea helvata TaxID=37484 RepID=A0ABV5SHQ0_9ACTN
MGSHGRGALGSTVLGSGSRGVLRHTHCPAAGDRHRTAPRADLRVPQATARAPEGRRDSARRSNDGQTIKRPDPRSRDLASELVKPGGATRT